jgi:hypothetical protein
MEAELEKTLPYYMAYEAIKEWFDPKDQEGPIIAYGASTDPDTMYYHEAMKEPDREQFLKKMQCNRRWRAIPRIKYGKWFQDHKFQREPRYYLQSGP